MTFCILIAFTHPLLLEQVPVEGDGVVPQSALDHTLLPGLGIEYLLLRGRPEKNVVDQPTANEASLVIQSIMGCLGKMSIVMFKSC